MNARIHRYEVMRTEVVADCYAGASCDQVEKRFRTYCDGDMSDEVGTDDILIKLADLPAGAVISVSYPCCPECETPREDELNMESGGALKIVGHKETCRCGFDWNAWVIGEYS